MIIFIINIIIMIVVVGAGFIIIVISEARVLCIKSETNSGHYK